jgi:hypothetical protein
VSASASRIRQLVVDRQEGRIVRADRTPGRGIDDPFGRRRDVGRAGEGRIGELGWFGFWSMMIFLGVLTVGFVYEWRKGALE